MPSPTQVVIALAVLALRPHASPLAAQAGERSDPSGAVTGIVLDAALPSTRTVARAHARGNDPLAVARECAEALTGVRV